MVYGGKQNGDSRGKERTGSRLAGAGERAGKGEGRKRGLLIVGGNGNECGIETVVDWLLLRFYSLCFWEIAD